MLSQLEQIVTIKKLGKMKEIQKKKQERRKVEINLVYLTNT